MFFQVVVGWWDHNYLSFLACAIGWSWEINYRFRVPHVDVEASVGKVLADSKRRPASLAYRCDAAQVVSRLQVKVDWLDTNK